MAEKMAQREDNGHDAVPETTVRASRRSAFWERQERFRLGHWERLRAMDFAAHFFLRLVILTWRKAWRDEIFMRASSLAFVSVLSMVPLLVVGGSLFLTFGGGMEAGGILGDVQAYLIPVAGDKITDYILEALDRAAALGTGPVGALALIITSVALFIQIEGVFNDLWRVEKRRPMYVRVLLFYALVTLGPLLVSFSVYQAARFSLHIDMYGFFGRLAHHAVIYAVSVGIFFAAFKLLPNTRVLWRYAILSAVVTSILFEIAKFGFNLYITNVFSTGYSAIYGAIGLVPVFLIWVYLSWTVVVFGIELSYCGQNLRRLMLRDKVERKLSTGSGQELVLGSLVAVEVMATVARGFARGEVPVPIDRICAESNYSIQVALAVMARLEAVGVVLRVEQGDIDGYVPARPLDEVSLWELVKSFEVAGVKAEHTPELRATVQRALEALRIALQTLSARDLASAPQRGRASMTTLPPVERELGAEGDRALTLPDEPASPA